MTTIGRFCIVVLVAALATCDDITDVTTEECNSPKSISMRFNMDSRRNSTGHWVSKVQLVHSDEGGKKGEPWTVDVQQSNTGCEGNGFVVIDAVLTSPQIDPSGYSKYKIKVRKVNGVGEYVYYTTPTSWTDARLICEKRNMYLAVPNSQREAEALTAIMNEEKAPDESYPQNTAHIGFNDMDSEGVYKTVTGQTLKESGYERWSPGNPNINFHEDCGGIDRHGLLHDVGCDHLLPFFCEKP